MKRLLLMRHADAVWSNGLADHDRPLSPRGTAQARDMGRRLAAEPPARVLVSSAARARETASALALEDRVPADFLRLLYEGDVDVYLGLLADLPAEEPSVMVVAHNPTLEALVLALSGERVRMSPGSLAVLEFQVDAWRQIPGARARLVSMEHPSPLPA